MGFMPCGTIALVVFLSCTSSAWAQDARDVINGEVRPGDKLTITTRDYREVKGRFLGARDDVMVLSLEGNEAQLRWSDISRVKRRRNGVLLGAIIGAGAGVWAGINVADFMQNDMWLTSMFALGLGTGIAIDALLSTNRTIYDRLGQTRLELLPQKGGGSVRVTLTW